MHSLTKTYTVPPSKMDPCDGSFDRSFLAMLKVWDLPGYDGFY